MIILSGGEKQQKNISGQPRYMFSDFWDHLNLVCDFVHHSSVPYPTFTTSMWEDAHVVRGATLCYGARSIELKDGPPLSRGGKVRKLGE